MRAFESISKCCPVMNQVVTSLPLTAPLFHPHPPLTSQDRPTHLEDGHCGGADKAHWRGLEGLLGIGGGDLGPSNPQRVIDNGSSASGIDGNLDLMDRHRAATGGETERERASLRGVQVSGRQGEREGASRSETSPVRWQFTREMSGDHSSHAEKSEGVIESGKRDVLLPDIVFHTGLHPRQPDRPLLTFVAAQGLGPHKGCCCC